jgi:hypothetical protein
MKGMTKETKEEKGIETERRKKWIKEKGRK